MMTAYDGWKLQSPEDSIRRKRHWWETEPCDPDEARIEEFEAEYGKLPKRIRTKLSEVLARGTKEQRVSGLTLMALKAFPGSPVQRLIQELRAQQ